MPTFRELTRCAESESTEPHLNRRGFLSLSALAIASSACDKIQRLLGRESESSAGDLQKSADPEKFAPADPNRPEFLDEKEINFTGLGLMMANNAVFDRYIFNAVTGNKSHAQTSFLQKGYPFEFHDGRRYVVPYHAFLFRPFDKRSNLRLPARLGKAGRNTGLAEFFRRYTVYRADNPKDIEAIKIILITSYELSFGIKLDPAHIKIESDADGRIQAIKYLASLSAATTIATETEQDEDDLERRNIVNMAKRRWDLVGEDGELYFPPTIIAEQGIALPPSAMLKYPAVKYRKTFQSQGRTIKIDMNISVDAALEEWRKLKQQDRPRTFETEAAGEGLIMTHNLGYYILENDLLVKELAEYITAGFYTKREKMQAILDFAHANDYVPDAYGESPRTPRVTLLSQGGDCEDSTILAVALARAVGIECVFALFKGHAAPLCDVGGEGTALIWRGKPYELCETTGGNRGVTEVTKYLDPSTGRITKEETKKRGLRIGEMDRKFGGIRFVSGVEDKRLTAVR